GMRELRVRAPGPRRLGRKADLDVDLVRGQGGLEGALEVIAGPDVALPLRTDGADRRVEGDGWRGLVGRGIGMRQAAADGAASAAGLCDGCRWRRGARVRAHRRPAPLARMARQSFSGVSGMSRCLMPSGESASMTAFTAAGVEAMVPASPIPFTPSGFVLVSVSVLSRSNAGTSSAVGTWYSIMLPERS